MKRKKLKIFEKYPATLNGKVLPTYEDVVRAIHEAKKNYRGKSYNEATKEVVNNLMEIWVKNALLPIINIKTISDKVLKFHGKYLHVARSKPTGKKYKDELDALMVIVFGHSLSNITDMKSILHKTVLPLYFGWLGKVIDTG